MIWCDLIKAPDHVDHSILLEDIYSYGIRGNAQALLASYLESPEPSLNGALSEEQRITTGVPQGSAPRTITFPHIYQLLYEQYF
ncbi:hypothetical protein Trydic_g12352 [Trypoxylus dichotomus]